jgi:hypothetical protein
MLMLPLPGIWTSVIPGGSLLFPIHLSKKTGFAAPFSHKQLMSYLIIIRFNGWKIVFYKFIMKIFLPAPVIFIINAPLPVKEIYFNIQRYENGSNLFKKCRGIDDLHVIIRI